MVLLMLKITMGTRLFLDDLVKIDPWKFTLCSRKTHDEDLKTLCHSEEKTPIAVHFAGRM